MEVRHMHSEPIRDNMHDMYRNYWEVKVGDRTFTVRTWRDVPNGELFAYCSTCSHTCEHAAAAMRFQRKFETNEL